jgi:UDP-N-acetylglucosamine:LPS N-acetylglucosamine transferase
LVQDILMTEIDRILSDKAKYGQMADAAKEFSRPDAARTIAMEILELALSHS